MMRQMKLIYALMLAMALPMMTACSSDDAANGDETPIDNDGKVQVHLRVSAADSGTMRAWSDAANATDDEMMNVWTVVIVNDANDEVVEIQSCNPSSPYAEIDDVTNLTPGTYRFYSFANIGASSLETLLGLPTGSVPVPSGTDAISTKEKSETPGDTGSGLGNIYKTGSNNQPTSGGTIVDRSIQTTINGNNFDPTDANNGLGAKGIPMSNVQTYTIASTGTYDLIVVRMMAKIKLQIKNTTSASIKVNSVTLSNVTQNSTDNLKLLPSLTSGQNTMEYVHGDIQPNLGAATQADLTIPITEGTIAASATKEVTFYVNECGTPNNAEGLFYLTLDIDNAGNSEYRYALINSQNTDATAADYKWDYIARNDYRIIPIKLDDLKFEIIPYDFPAIGVYPVSVKEVDAVNHIYDFEFHDYGHFHLLPSVTKGGSAVEFSATTPTSGTDYKWTLVGNNFANSWFTASTKGGAWVTTNTGIEALGFYRTGYSVTSPVDGDEVGGIPVWYVNDGLAGPQWAPDATNYRPFIFGYIEDPGSATKKQVYHEMKIQVYNGTVAYRQMLYRFYMTLSADQMLYSRMFGAPRVRHTHGY